MKAEDRTGQPLGLLLAVSKKWLTPRSTNPEESFREAAIRLAYPMIVCARFVLIWYRHIVEVRPLPQPLSVELLFAFWAILALFSLGALLRRRVDLCGLFLVLVAAHANLLGVLVVGHQDSFLRSSLMLDAAIATVLLPTSYILPYTFFLISAFGLLTHVSVSSQFQALPVSGPAPGLVMSVASLSALLLAEVAIIGFLKVEIEKRLTALQELVATLERRVVERERAQGALRESEQKYQALVEQSLQGLLIIQDLSIVFANTAFAEISGYSVEELLSLAPEDVVARIFPEDQALVWGNFRDRLVGKPAPLHYEYRAIRKDGAVRWLGTSANRIEYLGKPAVQVAVVDITERKQAEEAREQFLAQIREQAQQMIQVMDAVPEGMVLLDTDGQVILANPMAERDLTVLADAQVGDTLIHLGNRPLSELLTSPPKGLWHKVAAGELSFQVIARPIETGAIPGGWVLVIRDVTQQHEIEQRVQQQERLAAVGQLAAGIAHDFNNVMATIVLYAQMAARSESLSIRDRERMTVVNQQAMHASNLIRQILDFSRRSSLERQPLDLVPLFKEQVKLLERTLPESIKIDLTYGEGEYTIEADPTRIQQAVMNLAVNARDAMPEGGELRIGLGRIWIEDRKRAPLPEMEAGEWLKVTVSDTGAGIPSDVLPHIFEPFFTTKSAGEGTGLGLAQVWGIVSQHEGHIDVTTQVGTDPEQSAGTTFTLYLPALEPSRPEVMTQETSALPQGQGETILVVEDNATLREAVVGGLGLLNYCLLAAANGNEALNAFEQHAREIALVVSDTVMPDKGGVALLHALRERDWMGPVVLMSGHQFREDDRLTSQGVVARLQKPVSLEQLARVVAQALGNCV